MPQLPQKTLLASNVAKRNSKIIISLHWSKFVTHPVFVMNFIRDKHSKLISFMKLLGQQSRLTICQEVNITIPSILELKLIFEISLKHF